MNINTFFGATVSAPAKYQEAILSRYRAHIGSGMCTGSDRPPGLSSLSRIAIVSTTPRPNHAPQDQHAKRSIARPHSRRCHEHVLLQAHSHPSASRLLSLTSQLDVDSRSNADHHASPNGVTYLYLSSVISKSLGTKRSPLLVSELGGACLTLLSGSAPTSRGPVKVHCLFTVLHLVRRVCSINWAPVTSLHFKSAFFLH